MVEQETKSKQLAGNPSQDGEHGSGQSNSDSSSSRLKPVERFFAVLFLGLWLNLFAGGMLVHTEPYRCIISREGVVASQPLSNPSDVCKESEKPPAPMSGFWFSWFVVLFLYLPLNLALICVIAGALGTFGSIANLHADGSNNSPRDYSNPYMSGLLRGFFVYLFLISGLFLFDDDPFSNPSPNQYIRLAGFLSLFSFIVNYQPNTFSTLIDWAHARIHEKGRNTKAETTESNEASFEAVKHSKTNKDGSKIERTEIKAMAKGESESNLEEKTSDTGDERNSLSE